MLQDNYTLCLILLFLFIIGGILIRVAEKSWFTPSVVFSWVWISILGFSLATAPEYIFSPAAVTFIILCTVLFFCGGYVWQYITPETVVPEVKTSASSPDNKVLKLHLYASIACGMVAFYLLVRSTGFSILDLLKPSVFTTISMNLTIERYAGARLSSLTMLFLMVAYSGCLTGGRLFAAAKNLTQRLIASSVLIPILLFTVLYTARAVFLYALLLFLASLIVHYVFYSGGRQLVLKKKTVFILAGAGVGLFALFFFTQALRFGITHFTSDTFAVLANHLKVWFSGNVSAFCIWYNDANARGPLKLGNFTFAGLAEWIGFNERVPGIYTRTYDLDGQMSLSNIYTLFRFLIDDYGESGTLIIFLLLGALCQSLYNKTRQGNAVTAAFLSGILCWILFSFVASVFAYNTVLFAWLIFILLVYLFPDNETVADGKQ